MSADTWLLVAGATVSGAVGGFLLAFSGLVMPALRRVAPAEGVRAMQSINVVAVGPVVLGLLLAATATTVAAAWRALAAGGPHAPLAVAAAVAVAVGVVGVTGVVNVPLNERLAGLDPDDDATAAFWRHYLLRWTRWNTVRALSGLAACACLAAAAAAAAAAA